MRYWVSSPFILKPESGQPLRIYYHKNGDRVNWPRQECEMSPDNVTDDHCWKTGFPVQPSPRPRQSDYKVMDVQQKQFKSCGSVLIFIWTYLFIPFCIPLYVILDGKTKRILVETSDKLETKDSASSVVANFDRSTSPAPKHQSAFAGVW